ncbi:MAG: PIN domain-containing protein [Verrucomicrobia bacterium]|nr:PIN domain-containing protein [Verrucomicrobiota bacterium]
MVMVDSSVWIEGLRRDGNLAVSVALRGLLEEYEALWCGPVKLEVLGGARKEERAKLSFFFECIPYRAISDASWEEAKRLAWRLRDKGFSLPWNDILIASLAIRWNVRLYSIDRHFEIIRHEADLRLYQPGLGGTFQPG